MSQAKRKALVVEDQELFRVAVMDELEIMGFQVSGACDGQEGLKLALADQYDLVLSDIRMPNKDGRWFLNEFRKVRKGAPPFLFMTGFADLTACEAYDLGADGFLAKPLVPDKFNALIDKVCSPLEKRWSTQPSNQCVGHMEKKLLGAVNEADEILIGRGGAFLENATPSLSVGSFVTFDFKFDKGAFNHLAGVASIVWKRGEVQGDLPAGYGLSFEYIDPACLKSWLAFVNPCDLVKVIPNGGKEKNTPTAQL